MSKLKMSEVRCSDFQPVRLTLLRRMYTLQYGAMKESQRSKGAVTTLE